jgi:endonuclease-8
MPEGDTVWRTARSLHEVLAGQELTRFDLRVPRHATADLAGSTVTEVVARGKHILHRIADADDRGGWTLHTHLKMDGSWHRYRRGSRWQRPEHTVRAVLETREWQTVGYLLGVVDLVRTVDEDTLVGHLGPDLLGADWDPATATANLTRDPSVPIGMALLDQRNLAGLGTVYRAEVCFLRGVSPFRPAGEVDDVGSLVALSRRVIAANRDRVERTFTGSLRQGRFWVYGREHEPCRRCGTAIRKAEYGPVTMERIVYWCPVCQP